MRKTLNDNPVLQIVLLGALAVLVAFLLITRVMHKSDSSSTSTTPASPSAETAGETLPSDGSTAPATPETGTGAVPSTAAPSAGVPAAPDAGAAAQPPVTESAVRSKLVAGPGLPRAIADAYADDKAIVLLVFRNRGLDDGAVRASVEQMRGRAGVAVFVTSAGQIARYARITEGVDVNRVPALIVVRPRRLAHGAPTATVSYGFRGADSVEQAVRDALYKGPRNLPYYPR